MKIKALIFDLDDTLYRERDYVISGFMEVDKWVKRRWGREGFFEKSITLLSEGRRGTIFNETLLTLGIRFTDKEINQMLTAYREHLPQIKLYPDVASYLEAIPPNLSKGLITDGYLVAQKQKVKSLQLEPVLNYIIFTDAYGRTNWKPSPYPYQKMMEKMRLGPEAFVYIGDNPYKDFVTAKQLGWRTICVQRPEGFYSKAVVDKAFMADHTISSFDELGFLIEGGDM